MKMKKKKFLWEKISYVTCLLMLMLMLMLIYHFYLFVDWFSGRIASLVGRKVGENG